MDIFFELFTADLPKLKKERAKLLGLGYSADAIDSQIENIEKLFSEKQKQEFMQKHNKSRRAEHVERVTNKYGNYDEWFTWAKSLYIIHLNFTVESTARNWQEERSWACIDEIDALEKVEQLVYYKEYDRNRGRGDMVSDLI
jgi:hypothetical protein